MRSFCWVQLTLMFSSTDIWLLEGRTKNPQHFSGVFDIERERAMLHFMMAARKQKKKTPPAPCKMMDFNNEIGEFE